MFAIFLGYLLTVTAKDGGSPSLSDTTDVEISVVDVNDNAPVFKQQLYSANIMEDAIVGMYPFRYLYTNQILLDKIENIY